jgi:hypothetical protein
MECFGTTDFDNSSWLITLSAIIISVLHCRYNGIYLKSKIVVFEIYTLYELDKHVAMTNVKLNLRFKDWCSIKVSEVGYDRRWAEICYGKTELLFMLYRFIILPSNQPFTVVYQCFSTSMRPWPGKFFFHKTRARSQQIYS